MVPIALASRRAWRTLSQTYAYMCVCIYIYILCIERYSIYYRYIGPHNTVPITLASRRAWRTLRRLRRLQAVLLARQEAAICV